MRTLIITCTTLQVYNTPKKWRINITVTTLTGKISMDGHINLNYRLWEVWTRGPLSK